MVNYEKIKEEIKEMEKAFFEQAQIELHLNYILKHFESQLKALNENMGVLNHHYENIKTLINEEEKQ